MNQKEKTLEYLKDIFLLYPNLFYKYEYESLIPNEERTKLLCKWCYNQITFEKDFISILNRKEAIRKHLIKENTKKHLTFIQCKCHCCNKITVFSEDTFPSSSKRTKKQFSSSNQSEMMFKKEEEKKKRNKEHSKSKRNKKEEDSDEFRKKLLQQMNKKRQEKEDKESKEARESLFSFLQAVNKK